MPKIEKIFEHEKGVACSQTLYFSSVGDEI